MPSLVVPDSGLSLGSSPRAASKPGSATPAVLGLTLSDNVIEDMIKCFQNGRTLQLSLGEHPNILYGTKTQHLSTSDDPFTHELYRSTVQDSDDDEDNAMAWDDNSMKSKITRVESKPNAIFMGLFGIKQFNPALKPPVTASKASTTPVVSSTTGADAALAQLKTSLAEENAKKAENTVKFFKNTLPVPGSKKGSGKKFISGRSLGADTPRSIPSSPALSGVGSPSLGPTSVPLSQQQAEQAKAARKPVIHLLALGPTKEQDLKSMLPEIASNNLKQALDKVGDLVDGNYELRKSYYKELDVWSYEYASAEDRQRAIDNAVKQYDRMRLGTLEPEWDRLLPKAERGTGKCLSKLQAQIARGDLQQKPPKIKVQKDDASGRETSSPEIEVSSGEKKVSSVEKKAPKAKSDKGGSQQPTTKAKKAAEKETQPKKATQRWTAKNKAAQASAKKEKSGKAGGKVLSSEYVEDSDDEDDEPQQPLKPAPKPLTTTKRPREYDTESSDSSIPLSKKVKKDPPVTTTSHRTSDASQSSRVTNATSQSSFSTKTKDTSPQKSSPLASSPPTNASDVDNSLGDRTSSSSASPANNFGGKNSRSPIHKRHQKSSSVASSVSSTSSTRYLKPEVVDLARKYRSFYPKYEALHKEIASLRRRDYVKEKNLLDMHARLSQMKQAINAGIVEV